MRRPHSPLFVGVVPRTASAREANFAVAFFEAVLFFFAPQHAVSAFVFDCAPARGAPIPNAHTALVSATAAYRSKIFCILMFHSPNSFCKSIVEGNSSRLAGFLN